VGDEGHSQVSLWVGECSVDEEKVPANRRPVPLSHESRLQLGQDLVLQYLVGEVLPRRRLLPQTPGQQLSEAPPSKPTRTQPSPVSPHCLSMLEDAKQTVV
jgi:hypothetical protein